VPHFRADDNDGDDNDDDDYDDDDADDDDGDDGDGDGDTIIVGKGDGGNFFVLFLMYDLSK
jgi:hypothetical protein